MNTSAFQLRVRDSRFANRFSIFANRFLIKFPKIANRFNLQNIFYNFIIFCLFFTFYCFIILLLHGNYFLPIYNILFDSCFIWKFCFLFLLWFLFYLKVLFWFLFYLNNILFDSCFIWFTFFWLRNNNFSFLTFNVIFCTDS